MYLREVVVGDDANIEVTRRWVRVDGRQQPTPRWLSEFVHEIDKPRDSADNYLKATEVLKVLDGIPK
jgi:hypothetical protein